MSAEVLRQAAALMRERVALAPEQTRNPVRVEGVWLNARHYMPVEGDFLLAVANLLDMEADCELPTDYDESQDVGRHYLLKVAAAYLGPPP